MHQPIKQSKPNQTKQLTNELETRKSTSNKLRIFAYQLVKFNNLTTHKNTLNKGTIFRRPYHRISEETIFRRHGLDYEREY
jgi:hypothetical protein